MNKVSVIFGINGQDGQYLERILHANGLTVIGISRTLGSYITGDVTDKEFVKNIICTYKPAYIFHLAANSTTSHDAIFENHQTISNGTLNILEYIYQYNKNSKVFLSGSCLQFLNTGSPIKETDPFVATSGYSADRIYSVYAARYFRKLGLKVYIGYFFHHDSPLRPERHLNMKIIKTALRIKNGSEEKIEIGNPEVVKEFNHAYDLMQAIWLLVQQDAVFEATIGCGVGYTINDWVNVCCKIIGIDAAENIRLTPGYTPDFSVMISNPETIRSLHWEPKYNISDMAEDMINNGK